MTVESLTELGKSRARMVSVTPGFFRAMGCPLLSGRDFSAADRRGTDLTAVVNRPLARRLGLSIWRDGQRLRMSGLPVVLVGTVGDVILSRPDDPDQDLIFVPATQWAPPEYLLARSQRGTSEQTISDVSAVLLSLAPAGSFTVRALAGDVRRVTAGYRARMTLLLAMATLGIAMCAAGVYGGVTYAWTQARHSMAIRLALGGTPGRVRLHLLRVLATRTAVGLGTGIVGGVIAGRLGSAFLFGIAPIDALSAAGALGHRRRRVWFRRGASDDSHRARAAVRSPARAVAMNILETFSLAKRFGRIDAVRGLTLAVPQGSIYGILGPNGSGKTTTLGMTLGVVHPDEGHVAWFGRDGDPDARRRIGALLETPALYPSLSAEKNLAVVASIKRRGMDRIASVLEQVGLYDRRASPTQTYSLGMRQRLALAVVLLSEPEVMVLDEPTNGLDPHGIADVRTLIQSINTQGTTVIMASHVLDEVERVCTHVAVMKQGQLLAEGPIAAVLQSKHRMLVGSSDLTVLREVLAGIAGVAAVSPHGNLLEITVEETLTTESLNRQLFARNVVLTHLQGRTRGLEEAFLALVGDDAVST